MNEKINIYCLNPKTIAPTTQTHKNASNRSKKQMNDTNSQAYSYTLPPQFCQLILNMVFMPQIFHFPL